MCLFERHFIRYKEGLPVQRIVHIRNEEILIEANIYKIMEKDSHNWLQNIDHTVPKLPIMRVTEHLRRARIKLLWHILRADRKVLLHQATFNYIDTMHWLYRERTRLLKRRWLQQAMTKAFDTFILPLLPEELQEDINFFDPVHVEWLTEVAHERQF